MVLVGFTGGFGGVVLVGGLQGMFGGVQGLALVGKKFCYRLQRVAGGMAPARMLEGLSFEVLRARAQPIISANFRPTKETENLNCVCEVSSERKRHTIICSVQLKASIGSKASTSICSKPSTASRSVQHRWPGKPPME